MVANHLTVGEVATLYGLPSWKIQRAVDSLSPEVPRAGQYRLVPRAMLGQLAVELQHRRWLPEMEAATP